MVASSGQSSLVLGDFISVPVCTEHAQVELEESHDPYMYVRVDVWASAMSGILTGYYRKQSAQNAFLCFKPVIFFVSLLYNALHFQHY